MAIQDGFPAASGTVDSTELRKNLAGLILRDTSGAARAGVFPRHTNALVTSKASMAVDVAAFEGCAVRGGGPIFMSNDGTVSVTIDAAPGSNSRIDVVYFKQNESASPYSDANDNPIFGVGKGTAAPSPSKPTIPTGAVELATILIPSGVSATNAGGVVITQTFQYTTVAGGILWVRNQTERAALAAWSGLQVRMLSLFPVVFEYMVTADGVAADGWYPIAGRMPRCELAQSATAITTTSATEITGWSETSDVWGMHSTSSNQQRITVPIGGRYLVSVDASWANNSTNIRIVAIGKNGSYSTRTHRSSAATNPDGIASFAFEEFLAAGDYLTLRVYQDSGGNLNFSGKWIVSYLGA